MLLSQLIAGLELRVERGPVDRAIPELTDDSRAVQPGWLFIARAGARTDGRSFIADALSRGAGAIVTQQEPPPPPPPEGLPDHVSWVRGPVVDNALTGTLAERFFGNPGKKLTLIGVTGTKGKTTITFVI